MTRKRAMDLMTRLTPAEHEAAGKWVRAQLTPAQLPMYFVGVQEQLRPAQRDAGAAHENTR